MKVKSVLLGLLCAAFLVGAAQAFTAIATVSGQVDKAWYRASNFAKQKEADAAALEGCRVEARNNGIAQLAKQCKVVTRARGPGYGASVCGDEGCNWVVGYESGQAAVDAAYEGCSQSYAHCTDENIRFWEDFAGFAAPPPAKVTGGDCRPRTNTLRCQSSCTNGDCVLSYENGCKMRVQVQPRYDGFQNRWVYPSPSC